MIEPRVLKNAFAMAATLAASAALAQMTPAPQTSPQTTGTVQTAPGNPAPMTSSSDPLVQKRIDDKAANDEYKARKSEAKAAYKEEKKAAKSNRKAEKKEATAKRKEAMSEQGGPAQTPVSEGK
ncbi:hypothetical protein [Ralstonia flaminis]|jgi:hypothetical protein|uniref:Uncharacterized protein n=1 Tax=Ralstonia flaminis TaxID=3058597 RepID=A0ABN9JJB0_9RALS|nr:hypothetical protein [Ralstonia sp. LMG 18101]CAJ0814029.1 hypothetical protein LMG18101_02113 [Ralstonia sp. LMG 18101]